MCATRTLTSGPVKCKVTRRDARCRSSAMRPAAVCVICSAARCVSPACARAAQHEQRPTATLQTDMSSCTMCGVTRRTTRRLSWAGCGARGGAHRMRHDTRYPRSNTRCRNMCERAAALTSDVRGGAPDGRRGRCLLLVSRAASGYARHMQPRACRARGVARGATARDAADKLVELAIGPSCTLGPCGDAIWNALDLCFYLF